MRRTCISTHTRSLHLRHVQYEYLISHPYIYIHGSLPITHLCFHARGDPRWPGCVITESTAIDSEAGLLMWWRHVEPGEDDHDLPQASGSAWHWGGCWQLSEVAGVRYTTMFGDPGREFLRSGSSGEVTIKQLSVLLANPLSATFMPLGLE